MLFCFALFRFRFFDSNPSYELIYNADYIYNKGDLRYHTAHCYKCFIVNQSEKSIGAFNVSEVGEQCIRQKVRYVRYYNINPKHR